MKNKLYLVGGPRGVGKTPVCLWLGGQKSAGTNEPALQAVKKLWREGFAELSIFALRAAPLGGCALKRTCGRRQTTAENEVPCFPAACTSEVPPPMTDWAAFLQESGPVRCAPLCPKMPKPFFDKLKRRLK